MDELEVLGVRSNTLMPRGGGLHPPPEVLLSWPLANDINPVTRDWTGPAIVIAATIIAFIVYAARMWARLFVARNAGLDDALISFAMLPMLGLTISIVLGTTKYGYQWHTWDQTPESRITTREMALAIEITYLISTTLVKISILCFYRRLANGSISNLFKYCVWGLIMSVIVYCTTFTFLIVFTCDTVKQFTHLFDLVFRFNNKVHCRDEGAIIVAVSTLSTIQDFIICALPVFLVWNLQIPKRQKAALIGLFAVGLVTCVCGIMRAYYAIYLYYYTYDITWIAFYGWIWTGLEAELAVICASAPALKVFFARYFNLGTLRGTGYGPSGYGPSKQKGYSLSHNSTNVQSHIVSDPKSKGDGGWDHGVPLHQIQVSREFHVSTTNDRIDSISQLSDESTVNLTALPTGSGASRGNSVGNGGEDSPHIMEENNMERDIERQQIQYTR